MDGVLTQDGRRLDDQTGGMVEYQDEGEHMGPTTVTGSPVLEPADGTGPPASAAAVPGKPPPSAVGCLLTVLTVLLSVTVVLSALGAVVGLLIAVFSPGPHGPGHADLGLAMLVVGPPLAFLTASLVVCDPVAGRRLRTVLLGTPVLLLTTAAIGGLFAALAGFAVRAVDITDYYAYYGDRVTATLPASCADEVTIYLRSGASGEPDVCHGSTWTVDGVRHTGTVIGSWRERGKARSVPTYVIGDVGYTAVRVGPTHPVGRWGIVPWWWILLGLAGTVGGTWLLYVRIRWSEDISPRSAGRSAGPPPDAVA